jgi:hypothetical protein
MKQENLKTDWFKTFWIPKKIKYTGEQLSSLFAYLNYGVLGPSAVAFIGPCDISFANMKDGEDLREKAVIAGHEMLHFIFEIFDERLITGVFLQRLFAAIIKDLLEEHIYADGVHSESMQLRLHRSGDDLYWGQAKLSISIATRSAAGVLVHFAVNITNEGTPVETVSLNDFGIEAKSFAKAALAKLQVEMNSIMQATYKVR